MPLLIKFSIPLVLGSIFQQLYNFVDTAIVGRCISVQALASSVMEIIRRSGAGILVERV